MKPARVVARLTDEERDGLLPYLNCLWLHAHRAVRSFAASYPAVPPPAAADLVQGALDGYAGSLRNYRPGGPASLGTYLWKCAWGLVGREVRRHLRGYGYRRDSESRPLPGPLLWVAADLERDDRGDDRPPLDWLRGREPDPSSSDCGEGAAFARDVLRALPARLADVLWRRYGLGQEFGEIAQALGVSKQRAHQLERLARRTARRHCLRLGLVWGS